MSSREVREEAIKRTGRYLLQGWAMSAYHCQTCSSVLVHRGERFVCPGCEVPLDNGDTSGSAIREAEEPRSLEETKKQWDASRKQQNEISAKLGERMLGGWTLLGDTCPHDACIGSPLMRKKLGPMFCVNCETSFEYDDNDELLAVTDDSEYVKGVPPVPPAHDVSKAAAEENAVTDTPLVDLSLAPFLPVDETEPERDVSAIIGSKLLQGWAMLDETCSSASCSGGVPLMRDKKGQKHCFECLQVTTLDNQIVSEPPASSTGASSHVPTALARLLAPSAVAPPTDETQGSAKKLRSADQSESTNLADSISIVRAKIADTAQQLQRSQDVSSSTRLAELLARLADALVALQRV